jgi:hypothetical protein
MMSNLALIDNQTVRALGAELMKLPYVIEVRFFPVIAGELKELAGEDALLFVTLIRKDDLVRKVFLTVSSDLYLNGENHSVVIARMEQKIQDAISGDQITPAAIPVPPVIIPQITEEVPNNP